LDELLLVFPKFLAFRKGEDYVVSEVDEGDNESGGEEDGGREAETGDEGSLPEGAGGSTQLFCVSLHCIPLDMLWEIFIIVQSIIVFFAFSNACPTPANATTTEERGPELSSTYFMTMY